MGYRDNLKNRALPHARLADFYTVKVVYFCSGEWCVFIPALTTNAGLARTVANGTKLGRKKTVTDKITAQIIELRTEKKSIRAIASEVGVSTATVQRELKKVA